MIRERNSCRENEERFDRRTLLRRGLGSGLLLLLPMLPEPAGAQVSWVTAGPVRRFKEGVPAIVTLSGGKPVFVTRGPGGRWSALSALCTHEGARIRWEGNTKRYICPLHGATFSAAGRVLNGPARRPLAAYAVRRKGEIVEVSIATAATPGQKTRPRADDDDDRRDKHHEEREKHEKHEEHEDRD